MADRRKMSQAEIDRIAEAVVIKARAQCKDCSEEGEARHMRHHALLDKAERLLDRLENTRWKVLTAVLIAGSSLFTIAIVTWLVLRVVNIDLRNWR